MADIAKQIAYLTHEARLMIADEYRRGLRDDQPLDGVMIRLLLQSVEDDAAQERRLHDQDSGIPKM